MQEEKDSIQMSEEKEALLSRLISTPEERQEKMEGESAEVVFDIQKDPYNHRCV